MVQVTEESGAEGAITTAARVGTAGTMAFLVAAVAMHFIQPDLDPVDVAVSYYMNGRLGGLLGTGLVAFGVGSIATAYGLRRSLPGAGAGATLLALWGACAVAGGLFPPDPMGSWDQPPSLAGMIHNGAAMVGFLAFPVAAMVLSRAAARHTGATGAGRRLTVLALSTAVALVLLFVSLAPVFGNGPPRLLGLTERVLLLLMIAWLATANRFLARLPAGSRGARAAQPSLI